jgi:hypothetical protein
MPNKSDISQKKKRGRPKKTELLKKHNKQTEKHNNDTHDSNNTNNDTDEEIILDLPLKFINNDISEKSSDMNKFTMKDSDSKSMNTGSDNSLKEIENTISIKSLLETVEKQNGIISRLKDSLERVKSGGNYKNAITATKELVKTYNNIGLISFDNNKSVVVDTTNICCWWCTEKFETLPVFIPDRYTNNNYYVFGCFCSFSCAMSYNLELSDYRTSVRSVLIKKLYNIIIDKKNDDIPLAPKRELLKKFGGILSISEFRNSETLCKKEYKMAIPPIISLVPIIEETINDFGTTDIKTTSKIIRKF